MKNVKVIVEMKRKQKFVIKPHDNHMIKVLCFLWQQILNSTAEVPKFYNFLWQNIKQTLVQTFLMTWQ